MRPMRSVIQEPKPRSTARLPRDPRDRSRSCRLARAAGVPRLRAALAHLACVDILIAYPHVAGRVDEANAAYAQLLDLDIGEGAPSRQSTPVITEVIVGGVFELLHDYILRGQTRRLPELADHVSYLVLTPFIGSEAAARAIAKPERRVRARPRRAGAGRACRAARARARRSPASSSSSRRGDGADHRSLALEQRRDRLVDRVGREQVGRVDRVLLADAVAAVLGLVVLGGRPVELEERDVRGARQRDALPGDLDRADDQLVLAAVGPLEGGSEASRARWLSSPRCAARGEALERRRAGSRGGGRTRPSRSPELGSRGSRPVRRAACRARRAA